MRVQDAFFTTDGTPSMHPFSGRVRAMAFWLARNRRMLATVEAGSLTFHWGPGGKHLSCELKVLSQEPLTDEGADRVVE